MWPLDTCWKKSVQSCLDSTGLKKFYPKIPAGSCKTCVKMLDGNRAREVRNEVQKDFHGLCLDCMDSTKVTTSMDGDTGSEDGDRGTNGMSVSDWAYWEYDRMGDWGSRCRVKHGQPTWYFSYMGRKSDMQAHQQKMKKSRDEGSI